MDIPAFQAAHYPTPRLGNCPRTSGATFSAVPVRFTLFDEVRFIAAFTVRAIAKNVSLPNDAHVGFPLSVGFGCHCFDCFY